MTKQEFLEFISPASCDGYIQFEMCVDFQELCWANGIEYLNELVSDFVEDGHLISDLSYEPLRVEGGEVVVEVTACIDEWNEQFSEELEQVAN